MQPRGTSADFALLFAAFAAALGFGTLIPLVPVYLAASGADVAWHSGALPAVFLAAASVSAPFWGHLSDRVARRFVVMAGSGGAALAVIPFLLGHGLAKLYVFQVLAGLSYGAVAPSALALLYEMGDSDRRARRVAWFGAATIGGFLTGPALGGWLAALAEGAAGLPVHRVVLGALGAQSVTAAVAAVFVHLTAATSVRPAGSFDQPLATRETRTAMAALLAATLASFMIGSFEIATALHLRGPLALGSRDVAALFITCSAAMGITQLVFLSRISSAVSRVPLALALVAGSGALLAAMPLADSYFATLSLASLIGASLGLAVGLLGLQIATAAGARRGFALGLQNTAFNAGQAVGSMLGGILFASLGEVALALLGVGVVLLSLALHGAGRLGRL